MSLTSLNRERLASAAGLFNGDGSINVSKPQKGKQGQLTLEVSQRRDPEVLYHFKLAVLGLGGVYGPYGKYDDYLFTSRNFEEVQAIVAMLWPWLSSVKRAQASAALKTMKEVRTIALHKKIPTPTY